MREILKKIILMVKEKIVFKDGRNYNGDWKNNTMDGRGIFSWDNGDKYNGDYKNNIKEGNGVYSYGCNLYDGNWVNNKPHGEGTLLCDGVRIEGYFRYGKILEMIDGKGASRELTLKLTVNSKAHNKSLEEVKRVESMNDSIFARTEKGSESASKRARKSKTKTKNEESLYSKKNRKKENKNDESLSSKKNKSKDKDKRRNSKSKSKDKDKSSNRSSKE